MLRLRLAALPGFCATSPQRVTLGQKSPKLFAVAESLAFAVSDSLDESGQLPAVLYPAPVDPDDVAIQGSPLPVPAAGALLFKIPARRLRIAYGFGKWKVQSTVNSEQ